jgi:hypothetical protein
MKPWVLTCSSFKRPAATNAAWCLVSLDPGAGLLLLGYFIGRYYYPFSHSTCWSLCTLLVTSSSWLFSGVSTDSQLCSSPSWRLSGWSRQLVCWLAYCPHHSTICGLWWTNVLLLHIGPNPFKPACGHWLWVFCSHLPPLHCSEHWWLAVPSWGSEPRLVA